MRSISKRFEVCCYFIHLFGDTFALKDLENGRTNILRSCIVIGCNRVSNIAVDSGVDDVTSVLLCIALYR